MAVKTAAWVAPTTADMPKRFKGQQRPTVFAFASVADSDTFPLTASSATPFAVYGGSANCLVTYDGTNFTFAVTSGPTLNLRLIVWLNE